MSRKKIVAGNWKMNTNLNGAMSLAKGVCNHSPKDKEVLRIIFPPFPFIHEVANTIKGKAGIYSGAQNCSGHAKGAYTGEVSAEMIRSAGCEYVLVGHSERRTYFNETNDELKQKIDRALENKLTIIFCFGEKLEERKNNSHFSAVENQISGVLNFFPKNETPKLILAYEPVWAIGTGETATPAQAQEVHHFVRTKLSEIFSKEVSENIPLLYGGSCNAQNAAEIFSCPDVDGGLIGGASLKAEDFCKIVDSF